MMKTKIFTPKNVFSSQVLKPGYGPGSDKIVSAIKIFLCWRPIGLKMEHNITVLYQSPLGEAL